MDFNVEKCKVTNFGFVNKDYLVNGVKLGIIWEDKNLGIIACEDLKMGRQFINVVARGIIIKYLITVTLATT